MPSILIDDIPIEDYGLTPVDAPGALSLAATQYPVSAWPGRLGVVPSPRGETAPRVLGFRSYVDTPTAAARAERMDALADALAGPVEVVYPDAPDRAYWGVASVVDVDVPSPRFVNTDADVAVEIVCHNPARFDRLPRTRVITATPTPVEVGTASHGGVILLTGTAAGALSGAVTLELRAQSGVLVGSLTLTAALAAGESYAIDLDARTITHVSSAGVVSNAYGVKTAGEWFAVHRRDAAPSLGLWPRLSTSAGVALYRWRRAWRN